MSYNCLHGQITLELSPHSKIPKRYSSKVVVPDADPEPKQLQDSAKG